MKLELAKLKQVIAVIAIFLTLLSLSTSCSSKTVSGPTDKVVQQATVREKGAKVMPFELGKTIHTFEQRLDGGDQTVSVRNTKDSQQLKLVREHLKKIAKEFQAGNFSDPATIHGNVMPGLITLKNNPTKFTVTYVELTYGAKIEFRSSDPTIITALHQWVDAQVKDHGSDAVQVGMGSIPGMTPELMCQHHPQTCTR